MTQTSKLILWFEDCRRNDIGVVGGKNASLGEMVANLTMSGIKVPSGFATTSAAYRHYLEANNLTPIISDSLAKLENGSWSLSKTGSFIRQSILEGIA